MLANSKTALSTGDLKDGWNSETGKGKKRDLSGLPDRNRGHSQHSFSTKTDRDSILQATSEIYKLWFQINIFNFFLKRCIKKKNTPNRTLSFTMCWLDLVSTLTPFIRGDRPKALNLDSHTKSLLQLLSFYFSHKGYEGQYVVDWHNSLIYKPPNNSMTISC